ncbi:hypothetical protein E4U21_001526 [Claviceps maximensis]|nr:hypothetical protein E4U21_001526 [Claviceps maximensis]
MTSDIWSRRDSYPPTQIHLPRCNKNEPRPLLEDIDQNPLTYFLTPTDMDHDVNDFGADEMLFDAGIEDNSHQRDFVRSVSPSTLDGLSKVRAKAVSPDFDSDAITTDEEDDDDFVRFPPLRTSFLTPLRRSFRRRLSAENPPPRSESPLSDRDTNADFGNSPAPFSVPSFSSPSSSAPRATSRGGPPQPRARSYSAGSKLPPRALRLWRQPSPDVWSISEETEDDLLVMQTSARISDRPQAAVTKSKKKVRFLLTPRE